MAESTRKGPKNHDPFEWYNANDDQSRHLISGTDYADLTTGDIDSPTILRDNPMRPYTAGVDNGQFRGQLDPAIKADQSQQAALAGGSYQTQWWGMGKAVDMDAANSSKPYDPDEQEGRTGPVFPGGK